MKRVLNMIGCFYKVSYCKGGGATGGGGGGGGVLMDAGCSNTRHKCTCADLQHISCPV